MDTSEILVAVGGAVSIAFILWFFLGQKDESHTKTSGVPKPEYSCPMHPWIISDDPTATCSICAMKLTRGSN
jgi:hypothetical protein